MATKLRDGFDFYSALTETFDVWTAFGGNASFSAITRFSIGQSLLMRSNGFTADVGFAGNFNSNCSTIFLNFSHANAAPTTNNILNQHRLQFLDGATVQCAVTLNFDGSISFYRGAAATLLGTYSGAYANPGNGSWNHFQIKIVFNNVTGSFEVRKNGNTANDFALTGVDNCNTANNFSTSFSCTNGTNAPDPMRIDDLWMFDDTVVTGEPSNWIGDTRALQFMPTSDSAVALTRSAGANNFSNVDELVQGATDYVSGAAAGLTDEYGWAGFGGSPPTTILGVTQKMAALKMDAGSRTAGVRTRSGATVLDSGGKVISTGVVNYAFNIDLNPNTGAPWTPAELAAIKFGPRIVT